MNKHEAQTLLAAKLAEYRDRSYAELTKKVGGQEDYYEMTGPSGAEYQTEILFFWDDKAGGNLRVAGSIDDGGWRAYLPLTDSFIVASDGSFVGEDATNRLG